MDYSEQSSTVENRNPNEHKPLIHCAVDVHLQFVLEVLLSHFFSFTSCQTGWELVKCCFLLSLSSTQELIHAFALHCIVINKWDHKYPPSSAALVLSLRLLQWLRVSIDESSSLNGWTFPCCPPAKTEKLCMNHYFIKTSLQSCIALFNQHIFSMNLNRLQSPVSLFLQK